MKFEGITEESVEVIMKVQDILGTLVDEGKADWSNSPSCENAFSLIVNYWMEWCEYDNENQHAEVVDNAESFWTKKILEVLPSKKYTGVLKSSQRFMYAWHNGGGFQKKLCEVLTVSDLNNLTQLHIVYPDLVEGYVAYSHNRTWEDFTKDK